MEGRDYLLYNKFHRACAVLLKEELGATENMWLLGDPFLRAYYSIYDMEERRIGLVGVAETTRNLVDDQSVAFLVDLF